MKRNAGISQVAEEVVDGGLVEARPLHDRKGKGEDSKGKHGTKAV